MNASEKIWKLAEKLEKKAQILSIQDPGKQDLASQNLFLISKLAEVVFYVNNKHPGTSPFPTIDQLKSMKEIYYNSSVNTSQMNKDKEILSNCLSMLKSIINGVNTTNLL